MNIQEVIGSESVNEGFADLLQKHYSLDLALRDDAGKLFLSDWSCSHPFVEEYSDHPIPSSFEKQSYVFYSDDIQLKKSIIKFHLKFDHVTYLPNQILPGDGSTTFIATFCLWLLKQNIQEVYYAPPMYFTFNYFFELFKIKARPISSKSIFEDSYSMNLPDKKTILILCDPIWYIGQSIKQQVIEEIKDWQERTASLIFIDGSFQYTKWHDKDNFEYTSFLNPELTFRLVCPSKYLAVHGYRFSYLLIPSYLYNEFLYLYSNNVGSSCAYNLLFANQAINLMLSENNNLKLRQHISNICSNLLETGHIQTKLIPDSGYFIFAKITKDIAAHHYMDQDYFLLKEYPEYIRINLLGGKNLTPILT